MLNFLSLDIVFYRHGYLYHTPKDSIDHVKPGSLQHMGSGVLEVTKHLLQNERFATKQVAIEVKGMEGEKFTHKAVQYTLYGRFLVFTTLDVYVDI
jgi:hypothetical protein